MLCQYCIEKSVDKLQQGDLIVLDYLKTKEANSPQFSISKQVIMVDTGSTIHLITGSLQRLELLDFIGFGRGGSKSIKYYITARGLKVLDFVESKFEDVGILVN